MIALGLAALIAPWKGTEVGVREDSLTFSVTTEEIPAIQAIGD